MTDGKAPAADKLTELRTASGKQLKVLYMHGMESGPNGNKVQLLKSAGFDVFAPDMNPAIERLKAVHKNGWLQLAVAVGFVDAGLIVWLIRSRRYVAAAAAVCVGIAALMRCVQRSVRSVVDECLQLQYRGINSFSPDVCIGSSWGGAILIYAILRRRWRGPTLLLAPAHYKVAKYARYDDLPSDLSFVASKTTSVGVPAMPLLVVHGSADKTVPLKHTQKLFGRVPYAEIEVVSDDHRLLKHLTPTVLRERIEKVYALGEQAKNATAAAAAAPKPT